MSSQADVLSSRIVSLWPAVDVNRYAHARITLAHQAAESKRFAGELFRPFVPKTSQVLRAYRDVETDAMRVLMPDSVHGTSLCVLEEPLDDGATAHARVPSLVAATSTAVPSGQRIHAVSLLPVATGAPVVADSSGSVFLWRTFDSDVKDFTDCDEEVDSGTNKSKKRRRLDESTVATPHSAGATWATVVDAAASVPCRGAYPTFGSMGGWIGMVSSSSHLIVAREHFMDIRHVDIATGAVVQQFRTTHAASGLCSSPLTGGSVILVSEGPLVSLFDLRTSSRVAAHRQSFPSGRVHNVCSLPSSLDQHIAVCCEDRSVSIWDIRSWGRHVKLYANVLKHAVMNVAAATLQPSSASSSLSTSSLVCSGMDSEVRVLRFSEADVSSNGTTKKLSSTAKASTSTATHETPPVSTFRSRIDEAVHCDTTWLGGWAAVPPARTASQTDCTESPNSRALLIGASTSNDFYAVVAAEERCESTITDNE